MIKENVFLRSHEGRKILMLKIGKSPRGSDTRAVWIDGGIHARLDRVRSKEGEQSVFCLKFLSLFREWVAISTATFLLDRLVAAFKLTDDEVSAEKGCDMAAIRAVDW